MQVFACAINDLKEEVACSLGINGGQHDLHKTFVDIHLSDNITKALSGEMSQTFIFVMKDRQEYVIKILEINFNLFD